MRAKDTAQPWIPLAAVLLLVAAHMPFLPTLGAQASDSAFAGRHCDQRLAELRIPSLLELGDSARLDAVLSRGADPQAHTTGAELRFGKDGLLRGVDVKGARSSSARSEIRDTIRAAVRPISGQPRDFNINLVRVNTTGLVRILAGTATCPALQNVTPEAKALVRQIQRDAPGPRVYRRAVVDFILEPDGHVSDSWIDVSTGVPGVDSLAMQIFRAMHFNPAIAGRTTVAALLTQPFEF
jgi:TonB family protein